MENEFRMRFLYSITWDNFSIRLIIIGFALLSLTRALNLHTNCGIRNDSLFPRIHFKRYDIN